MNMREHAALRRRHIRAIRGNVIYLRPWPRKVNRAPSSPSAA